MEVKFTKLFEKDLKGISEKEMILKVHVIIKQLIQSKSLKDMTDIKKLKGHKDCYRIRIGNHRLGLKVESKTVWIARLLNRKDIYKYFP